jgi:uncharacterized protein
MSSDEVIKKTASFVRKTLENDNTGHDWWHIERVYNTAVHIAKKEKANMFVVELAALLHDIADWKFHQGDEKAGGRKSREWLASLKVDEEVITAVCDIVDNIGFKGGVKNNIKTIEGKVVQDADRLDAMGAVGISRVFAYGGHKGRPIYNPEEKAKVYKSFSQYKNASPSSINHFYEKLLLLKDLMNTKTGKKLAKKRHDFLKVYLKNFFKEWQGKQ